MPATTAIQTTDGRTLPVPPPPPPDPIDSIGSGSDPVLPDPTDTHGRTVGTTQPVSTDPRSGIQPGGVAGPQGVSDVTVDARRGRALKPGEAEMIRQVFGDSVDLSRVKIYDKKYMPFQGANTAMAPNGNIYFGRNLYKDDFSLETPWTKKLFLHEMTHVWQHQMGINVRSEGLSVQLSFGERYSYSLDANKALLDYNVEQQAEIVSRYFSATLYDAPYLCPDIEAHGAMLAEFISDSSYARAVIVARVERRQLERNVARCLQRRSVRSCERRYDVRIIG